MTARIFVFDAYGTLFDVHAAVRAHGAALGPDAGALSQTWRAKQLEYSWVRSLIGPETAGARDFWALTGEALDFAFAMHRTIDRKHRAALLDAYWHLAAYPKVTNFLERLKAAGHATAILSNGSRAMLDAAVRSAGLGDLLDAVLSVETLGTFKTAPETYRMVTRHFAVSADAVSFQSSNRWDIAGAAAFGFATVWINRFAAPDEYGDLPPGRVIADLSAL